MFELFRQRKYQFLFFLMGVLTFLISSCGAFILPIEDENISNQNSPLLKIVDCNRDAQAGNGWNWSTLYVGQEIISPSLENDYASERAWCHLVGGYSSNWFANHYVDLIYAITKYDKPATLTQDSVKMEDFNGTSSFSPELVMVGGKMYINCLNGRDSMFSCLLQVQYNYISLSVRLTGNQGIGVKNIENFVNAMLARLDVPIKAIDQH